MHFSGSANLFLKSRSQADYMVVCVLFSTTSGVSVLVILSVSAYGENRQTLLQCLSAIVAAGTEQLDLRRRYVEHLRDSWAHFCLLSGTLFSCALCIESELIVYSHIDRQSNTHCEPRCEMQHT
jgi:hypothetical protein